MSLNETHLVICRNPKALEHLKNEMWIIGICAEKGIPMLQGDALCARDELLEAGFVWGKDFYLKIINTD